MYKDVHPPPVEVDENFYGIDYGINVNENDDQDDALQVRPFTENKFNAVNQLLLFLNVILLIKKLQKLLNIR